MRKVNDVLWINNGFTSCVAFAHKAHGHGNEQQRQVLLAKPKPIASQS